MLLALRPVFPHRKIRFPDRNVQIRFESRKVPKFLPVGWLYPTTLRNVRVIEPSRIPSDIFHKSPCSEILYGDENSHVEALLLAEGHTSSGITCTHRFSIISGSQRRERPNGWTVLVMIPRNDSTVVTKNLWVFNDYLLLLRFGVMHTACSGYLTWQQIVLVILA